MDKDFINALERRVRREKEEAEFVAKAKPKVTPPTATAAAAIAEIGPLEQRELARRAVGEALPLIYVAGPYRPLGCRTAKMNLELAKTASIRLMRTGFAPIIPWLVESGVLGPCDDDGCLEAAPDLKVEDFLAVDRAQLEFCKRIYMIPGWLHSEGATYEKSVADALGVKRHIDETLDITLSYLLERLVAEAQE